MVERAGRRNSGRSRRGDKASSFRARPLPHCWVPPRPSQISVSPQDHVASPSPCRCTWCPGGPFPSTVPPWSGSPAHGPSEHPLCSQEKRIASLDAANARLMSALTQLKERYSMQARNGISPTNPTKLQITENGEFRNSSNC